MPTNPDQKPWEGTHVYRVLKEKKNGRRYALVSGWPTPVSEYVRTQFPPLPGRASYSIEARRWCKTVLKQNRAEKKKPKAERRWIGAYSLRWIRAVAAGKRPLAFWQYKSLRTYLDTPRQPKSQPVVPVRLQIPGWGLPRPGFQTLMHQAGRTAHGPGGYVRMPDIADDDED